MDSASHLTHQGHPASGKTTISDFSTEAHNPFDFFPYRNQAPRNPFESRTRKQSQDLFMFFRLGTRPCEIPHRSKSDSEARTNFEPTSGAKGTQGLGSSKVSPCEKGSLISSRV